MSKKTFVIIGVLSVVVTYGLAILDFVINTSKNTVGIPFGFSTFNFFGAEMNSVNVSLNIIFWFIILFLIQQLINKLFGKK